MSNSIIGVPKEFMSFDSFMKFKKAYMCDPILQENNINEDINKNLCSSTVLKQNRFVFQLMDIPSYNVRSVEFLSENKLEVTFAETAEFCVEKYFKNNFDVLELQKIYLKYLDETGAVVRTDTYTLKRVGEIKKEPLNYENDKGIIIKVQFYCSSHDISTCKE